MELEEAKKMLEKTLDEINNYGDLDGIDNPKELGKAIQTVLSSLENSIPVERIEHDLKVCEEVYEREMKPYQREYGLDVTYLNKKEKAELINKRNCLITQIETYKQLLKKE